MFQPTVSPTNFPLVRPQRAVHRNIKGKQFLNIILQHNLLKSCSCFLGASERNHKINFSGSPKGFMMPNYIMVLIIARKCARRVSRPHSKILAWRCTENITVRRARGQFAQLSLLRTGQDSPKKKKIGKKPSLSTRDEDAASSSSTVRASLRIYSHI